MPQAILGTGTYTTLTAVASGSRETSTAQAMLIVYSARRKHEERYDVVVLCWLLHWTARGTAASTQRRHTEAVVDQRIDG
jgi:hypothetical protein